MIGIIVPERNWARKLAWNTASLRSWKARPISCPRP